MMRKYHVRFGGGPGEKAEQSDLARGLPYRNIQHTVRYTATNPARLNGCSGRGVAHLNLFLVQ